MKKHLVGLLAGVTTFAAALLCLPFIEFQVGRAEARWDSWHGRHQLMRSVSWCVQAEPTKKWERMLAERFGFNTIKVEDYGPALYGYNEFQREEFDRLFGAGAFEREADAFHREWLRELREQAGTSPSTTNGSSDDYDGEAQRQH